MNEFDKIYLSWRKAAGARRYIVGVIEKHAALYSFHYDADEVNKARNDGFALYIEFPDINKRYSENVLEIFSQRLIKSDRPDIKSFYDFWEIEPKYRNDKFYLLGHTQGLLPTDNFEFLADYNPIRGLHFLSDIAGSSHYTIHSDKVQRNDILTYELEPDNQYDKNAVMVMKGDLKIGYIKKIHCLVFSKPGAENLHLQVKEIEGSGIIKRLFIKVFN